MTYNHGYQDEYVSFKVHKFTFYQSLDWLCSASLPQYYNSAKCGFWSSPNNKTNHTNSTLRTIDILYASDISGYRVVGSMLAIVTFLMALFI